MGFIVFSNLGDTDPNDKALQLANLFIKDNSPKKPVTKPVVIDSAATIVSDTLAVKKFTGDYISDDGAHFVFKLKNKKLYWEPNGNSLLLAKALKDTFVMFARPEVKFVFAAKNTKETIVDQYWPDNHRLLKKYDAVSKRTDEQLRAYTGKYYCPELDCSYGIALKDHALLLTNSKYDDAPLTLYGEDHLRDSFWWMDSLLILRNTKGQITGFEVNSGRIRHVLFKKIE